MPHQHTPKKPHHLRDDLTGEHKAGDAGQLLLAIVFAAVWIADSFFFEYTTFLNRYVSNWIRMPVALAVLAVSGYLALRSLAIVFGEERETPSVIRKGVFKVVRHPMYLSEVLLYLGLLMLSLSLAAAVVWVVAIGFLYYISRHEERLLVARFGEEYEQYQREVPMWFPRIMRR
ncbi:methyltransferase family protein [Candidatus Neomarinimicrobiota bacterium]